MAQYKNSNENLRLPSDDILREITRDFLEKIRYSNDTQLGVFSSFQKIAEISGLWELSLILEIAKHEPLKTDLIITKLEAIISKSTIYRKINHFIEKNVIEQKNGYLYLNQEFHAISTIAKLTEQSKGK